MIPAIAASVGGAFLLLLLAIVAIIVRKRRTRTAAVLHKTVLEDNPFYAASNDTRLGGGMEVNPFSTAQGGSSVYAVPRAAPTAGGSETEDARDGMLMRRHTLIYESGATVTESDVDQLDAYASPRSIGAYSLPSLVHDPLFASADGFVGMSTNPLYTGGGEGPVPFTFRNTLFHGRGH
jgi:hypothetical protein